MLFFKLLGSQLPNEYASLLQQPERINYIPHILKLLQENKLYRKPSWSDISSQKEMYLGKGFYCGVCVCVCMYAYVSVVCMWVYVYIWGFKKCSKGMDERDSLEMIL